MQGVALCGVVMVGRSRMEWCERLMAVSTCFRLSVFGRCRPHELINFEIGRRCSSCLYWAVSFLSWNVSDFCEATPCFEMHSDRSRFDVTRQDLGVLESCWPPAAMAPQKQWLSLTMVREEDDFRTFLGSSGSSWPDAMVAENQGGQCTVESERFDRRVRKIYDVYCRNNYIEKESAVEAIARKWLRPATINM